MCNNCVLFFGNGYKKTFASLANFQYYNVTFYTNLEAGFSVVVRALAFDQRGLVSISASTLLCGSRMLA